MSVKSSIYFDYKDRELLTMVNRMLERDIRVSADEEQSFFHSALHPHGIKELSMSQEIRVAYSVANLLDTLDTGQLQDRIDALRALHTEVLSAASSSFRYNTGRVLIQIMKSLIRAHGNTELQLQLAHDFRHAAMGKRRFIRKMLRRYYLLEMPEEWNQIAFDNHVHDANTKGRKSPTQLIMDAWIKGLRKLDVLYYNFVEPAAVSELLQAADIMDIRVRVGVEFQAGYRGRFVQFTWQPRGFLDWRDMLAFFQEKPVQHLMRVGREASQYHHNYVMRLLAEYNSRLRFEMGDEYGLHLSEIPEEEILSFVGIGQTARTHLAELIYRRIRRQVGAQMNAVRANYGVANAEDKETIRVWLDRINELSPDRINTEWLNKERNPSVTLAMDPEERDKIPEIMRLLPSTLIDWLISIRSHSHITLNLNRLTAKDVLELIYECDGMISHLEVYNLKNYEDGKMLDLEAISELQRAINEGSAIALKRLIRNMLQEMDDAEDPGEIKRCQLFREILRNIPILQEFYSKRPLGARLGSDSTGRSSQLLGMGFAHLGTLPRRARETVKEKGSMRKTLPFTQDLHYQVTYYLRKHHLLGLPVTRFLRRLPSMRHFGKLKKETWVADAKTARYDKNADTITTLGGFQRDNRFAFRLDQGDRQGAGSPGLTYLNTTLKNVFKVLAGFILTFATFQYTQHWWVLAWFGPFIWFGITGFRNIAQSVLGGGGFSRTPLLRWNDYLSWSRVCDSLLFTGISVPLLELGVRAFLLQGGFGITSMSNPVIFFAVMSLVNGAYISCHNIYRGLPQEATIGNIFRSFLAVPVSVLYSYAAVRLFELWSLPVEDVVQSAAVLSKMASDTVAALIEGLADRTEYLRRRDWDYSNKFDQLFAAVAKLEVLLPEDDVLELLRRPRAFLHATGRELRDLETVIIINALDLMYFWMYLPRAQRTLLRLLTGMTVEEREIFVNTQLVLTRVQEVSQLLVDGLVGMKFARPLAFYLDKYEAYLRDMSSMTGIRLARGERRHL